MEHERQHAPTQASSPVTEAAPLPKASRIRARLIRYTTGDDRPLVSLGAGSEQGVMPGAKGRIVGRPRSSFVVVEVEPSSCEISFDASTDGLTGYADFEIDRELPNPRR